MDTIKTGSYLAALRKNAGMTQQEVADRLSISNKTISKWESGGGFPDIAILPALAELYGVTADDILAGETVRGSTGGRQVEQYLAQRGALRWQIGYAAAVLCLITAVLLNSYFYYSSFGYVIGILMLPMALAALWVGWGSCPREALRRRMAMLLPCGAMLAWNALGFWITPGLTRWLLTGYPRQYSMGDKLHRFIQWDLTLLLLPAVYVLLRSAVRRWSDDRFLLPRPYFRVTAAIWLAAVAEEIVHWIVALPPTLAYAASTDNGYWAGEWIRESDKLLTAYAETLSFSYVPGIVVAVTILALVITAVATRQKQSDTPEADGA